MATATAANPNPARITDAMWRLWTEVQPHIPGVQLGGIYADKRCYHNTVEANQANWPYAYCVQLPLDLAGPRDKARAVDLTMSDAQMRLRTGYLRDAALHPQDDRLKAVREFFGTVDGTVYGLARDTDRGGWRRVTSDPSHLWHIHISVWTTYCDRWDALAGLASVLVGQSWEGWQQRERDDMALTPDEIRLLATCERILTCWARGELPFGIRYAVGGADHVLPNPLAEIRAELATLRAELATLRSGIVEDLLAHPGLRQIVEAAALAGAQRAEDS